MPPIGYQQGEHGSSSTHVSSPQVDLLAVLERIPELVFVEVATREEPRAWSKE
jgi:hypothetical protein